MKAKLAALFGLHAALSILLMALFWGVIEQYVDEKVGNLIRQEQGKPLREATNAWAPVILLFNCAVGVATSLLGLVLGVIALRAGTPGRAYAWMGIVGALVWLVPGGLGCLRGLSRL